MSNPPAWLLQGRYATPVAIGQAPRPVMQTSQSRPVYSGPVGANAIQAAAAER